MLLGSIGILKSNNIFAQHKSTKTLDVKEKIALIRKECCDTYKSFYAILSTSPYFKELSSSQKKVFPKTLDDQITVTRSFSSQGAQLLYTIDALTSQQYLPKNGLLDQVIQEQLTIRAKKTLEKIQELFCLKFLCMICSFDCSKSIDKTLLKQFYNLLTIKTSMLTTEQEPPFKGLLTEIAITILMVKFSSEHYNTKKESLVYNLNFILERMLRINNSLGLYHLNPNDISEFIDLLGQYALTKPIVSPDRMNILAKTTIAALIIGALVCYAINKEAPKWLQSKCKEVFGGVMDFLGPNYLGENTIKAVKKDINNVMNAEQTTQLIETSRHMVQALHTASDTIRETTAAVRPIANCVEKIHWKGVGYSLATFLAALSIKAVVSCF